MSKDFKSDLAKAMDDLDADRALELIDAAISEAKDTLETLEGLRSKTTALFGRN